jgi:hypothetical protein
LLNVRAHTQTGVQRQAIARPVAFATLHAAPAQQPIGALPKQSPLAIVCLNQMADHPPLGGDLVTGCKFNDMARPSRRPFASGDRRAGSADAGGTADVAGRAERK